MRRWMVSLSILALALVVARGLVHACGPFLPEAVFVNLQRPDSLEAFAGGRLGVLEPTYARSYLCVAYRVLSGVPLDATERAAATTLWKRRLTGWMPSDSTNGMQAWLAARSQVAGAAPLPGPEALRVERWRNGPDGYSSYLACPDAAYATAAATLLERAGRLGWQHPEIRAWVEAQDSVFAACSRPTRLPDGSPTNPAARADRAYQEAALAFYRGEYDEAANRFDRIAADATSPWRTLAPYLAARAETRRATLVSDDAPEDSAGLARADARIEAILADTTQASARPAALALRGYVCFRLDPASRLRELSSAVLTPHSGAALLRDLDDLTLLLDTGGASNLWRDDRESGGGAGSPRLRELQLAVESTELTDWVLAFQRGAAARAVERWRATQSLPWLVVALADIPATDPARIELLKAAAGVPADSPAAPTLAFHRARLLAGSDDAAGAREVLHSALESYSLPYSARIRMLAACAALAVDFPNWIRLEVRAPVWVWPRPGYDQVAYPEDFGSDSTTVAALREITQHPVCFDEDACAAFNRGLPLDYWLTAARNEALPARLRGQIALAGWTRAALLGRDSTARPFVPALATLVPVIATDARAFSHASDATQRDFAATLLLLRTPGARPYLSAGVSRVTPVRTFDRYGDNWWASANFPGGSFGGRDVLGSRYGSRFEPVRRAGAAEPTVSESVQRLLAAPAFVTRSGREALTRELTALLTLPPSADWLASRALSYAQAHPGDPRVPEALHLAVRATRVGFGSEHASHLAHEAFTLLHRRYPASTWTAQTKYWY